jgi:hypothetical protein
MIEGDRQSGLPMNLISELFLRLGEFLVEKREGAIPCQLLAGCITTAGRFSSVARDILDLT